MIKTITWVGLLAGTLDIFAACIQAYLVRGTTPVVLLQYIASAAVGKQAYAGGWPMALLGLLFHYIIAYSFTVLFFLVYPHVKLLWKSVALNAIVYGIFMFVTTNMLLLPLTKLAPIKYHLDKCLIATAILIVAIGLPVAYFTKHFYSK